MGNVIIISNVYIGHKNSKIKELSDFIESNPSHTLVLNGDIFDQRALWKDKGKRYRYDHKEYVDKIRNLLKERKTEVYYLIGDHDYLAFLLIPFSFLFGIKFRKRIQIHKYLIEHGNWIKFYLKVRKIFNSKIEIYDDYFKNCLALGNFHKTDFIVGHDHLPVKSGSGWRTVYNGGDWINHKSSYIFLNDIWEPKILFYE